jgi:hypothetical protein
VWSLGLRAMQMTSISQCRQHCFHILSTFPIKGEEEPSRGPSRHVLGAEASKPHVHPGTPPFPSQSTKPPLRLLRPFSQETMTSSTPTPFRDTIKTRLPDLKVLLPNPVRERADCTIGFTQLSGATSKHWGVTKSEAVSRYEPLTAAQHAAVSHAIPKIEKWSSVITDLLTAPVPHSRCGTGLLF